MKSAILGAIGGLFLGAIGALGYNHYLGDGSLLADLQAELDSANAKLAKVKNEKKDLANETSGVSDQVDELQKTNDDLKKQLNDLKSAPPATAVPNLNPMTIAGIMGGMMRGGRFQTAQQMLLLQTRLKLTPDQAAKIKAAMEADAKARRAVMQQMFRNNGKVDPQMAASANTLDQTLSSVLSQYQQNQYQQLQAEEKASRADTSATVQVDQLMPLLQLSDSQKDQVANALYQIQLNAPDPMSLMGDPNAGTIIAKQALATQDALAKTLTPDQMALYQQQAQVMPAFGGGFGRPPATGGNPAPGSNGASGGATVSVTAASASAPTSTPSSPSTAAAITNAPASSTTDASTTNAPTSSTTNATGSTPPPATVAQ